MPDVSALIGRLTPIHINNVFWGFGIQSSPARLLLTSLVRLVDKSGVRVRAGPATRFAKYVGRPSNGLPYTLDLLRGGDHLETCFNALYCAALGAERLRPAKDVPQIELVEQLSPQETARLRKHRHFAEHIDQKVAGGFVGADSPLMQVPLAEGLEFAGDWLTYAQLAELDHPP